MPAIETEGLAKTFPGGVEAVRGIDLAVREGEIFAFLGPNGAGKSTTVRMLTTLLRPTGGRARVGGYDVLTEPHHVRFVTGVALQEAGLDDIATGRELLVLQARLARRALAKLEGLKEMQVERDEIMLTPAFRALVGRLR